MEQLTLFKDDLFLDASLLEHCMLLQEELEKFFDIRLRKSGFRVLAFHVKDKEKFIARIGGNIFFCQLQNKRIEYIKSFHGNGDKLYKWVSYLNRNNEHVDLMNLKCY
ncbi:hypothetical protein [Bacillus sp. B15-48]|uniref:hypothetical protein n=1 Tax=Bacillus sp. B15-48 TaxID=1548601 RepID=UPI00193FA369|nr:hypothetical protein [Bacillus sp. B15-48]MBM4762725.1 hypothetical protein [Bacillus sp. B15-48]